MTPTRTLTLALVCAVALTRVQTAHAQTPVCKIYGTVDSVAGKTSALTTTKAQITVTRASKSGSLFLNTSRVFNADANGRIEFYAPRTVGTDTAVIHIRANFGDLSAGQTVYIPDADSAELRTLPRYTANPTLVVVAVPSGGGSGDTSLNGHPRLTRIEDVEGQFTAGTSDSIQQNAANAYVARNVAEGKANADSVHTVLVALSNLIAGKGSADSIHSQLVTLYNLVAGKPSADSVHAAIAAMLKMSDTTALHAQRFAVINDSLFAISLRATSTANDLTAHASTADAHLPSQTGASGKFLQSNGTVSSWQTALTAETDPTAIPRTDSTRFVSRTAPQIPGLASADTNTVIGVDASGNLVLRKDDAGGGAALTNWEDPDTSATQASRTLKPKAFTANVNAVIRPLGTGAFILGPPPDGTATGGNARGANAVDLQLSRNAATQVASGGNSIAIGTRNTAAGTHAIAIGYNATTTKSGGAFGFNVTSSGTEAYAFGNSVASGDYSFAAGLNSAAQAEASVAIGWNSNTVAKRATAIGFYALANDSGQVSLGQYPDTLGVVALAVGVGTGEGDRRNALTVYKDGSVRSTAYTRNVVTVGSGDSVVVTGLQDMLPTDAVALAYQAGKTAHSAGETILSYAIYSATTLTIYGVENRKVAWIRMR